jgi:type II secretory pathway component GspD/PulD (secretin)
MSKTYYALLATWALVAPAAALADDPAPTTGPGARITLDYVNAEVSDVLRALAAQSKVNIALKPGVKGQVTVHLRDKTVDDSIQMVASLSGLTAKRVRETYFVSPQSEMKATLERLGVSRTVTLKKLPGKDGAELVSNTFPDVTVRASGSTLTLIGSSDDVEAAERMIVSNDVIAPEKERISVRYPVKNLAPSKLAPALAKMVTGVVCEQAGDGVLVAGPRDLVEAAGKSLEFLDKSPVDGTETRVYNIRYSPPNQLIAMVKKAAPNIEVIPGPEVETPTTPRLNLLAGQFIGAGGGSGGGGGGGLGGSGGGPVQQLQQAGTGPVGGAPTTSATGDVLVSRNILSMLLRGPASDVAEAVKVLEMVDIPPKQMSIEARVAEVSPDFSSQIGVDWKWNDVQFVERPHLGQTGTPIVPSAPLSIGQLGFGNFGRTQFNPIATLNAMVTSKRAKLLASPNVMVLNDSDASIFIGDTLRFNTLATSGPNTGNQFTVVEVPVGIILLVHPRVNDDGHITLRVHPVVSTVSGFSSDGLPQTSAREAETTVRVKDGDTIVIGGLIRDEDIRSMSKIPLLGDLPFIGYLFKKESRTNRRTEVTVFLTIRMMPQQ